MSNAKTVSLTAVAAWLIALVALPLGPEEGTLADVLWLTQMVVGLFAVVMTVRAVVLWRRRPHRGTV